MRNFHLCSKGLSLNLDSRNAPGFIYALQPPMRKKKVQYSEKYRTKNQQFCFQIASHNLLIIEARLCFLTCKLHVAAFVLPISLGYRANQMT